MSELWVQPDKQRLYRDLAWLWPVISPPEDYAGEAGEFIAAIRQYAQIEVQTLLDLGCGGGHNDFFFQQHFQVTGVDLSPEMLELARQLNPRVTYQLGDMRTVRLGQLFDVVIIADSIDYMLDEGDLLAAFRSAYQHLKPGGIFCTYAEETPDRFQQNNTYSSFHNRGALEVTLVENYYDPDPGDTTFETTFVYLIRQSGKLSIEVDHHLGGIFPLDTWTRLLDQAGFVVQVLCFEEGECPMFVCTRPGAPLIPGA